MKNILSVIVYTFITAAIMTSCSGEKSLQEYYIEKQDSNDFIAIDLPASLINLQEDVSAESQETYKTLKKLNILAFKIDEENKSNFDGEAEEIKKILGNKKFNDLMRGKHEGVTFSIKYLGDEETMDEIVIFASDKKQGFLVARILGDGMEPAKIMKLMKDVEKMDGENPAFAQIGNLLGGIK